MWRIDSKGTRMEERGLPAGCCKDVVGLYLVGHSGGGGDEKRLKDFNFSHKDNFKSYH